VGGLTQIAIEALIRPSESGTAEAVPFVQSFHSSLQSAFFAMDFDLIFLETAWMAKALVRD
jgi:hypothetical protein